MQTEQAPTAASTDTPAQSDGPDLNALLAAADAHLAKTEGKAPADPEPVAAKEPEKVAEKAPEKTEEQVRAEEQAAVEADPKLKMRLEIQARNDARLRAKLRADQEAFEAQRKELEPALTGAQEFQALKARAAADPLAALRALGITDLAKVAELAYGATLGDKAPADLKIKNASHELLSRLDQQAQEIRALRESIQQREQQENHQRVLTQYRGQLEGHLKTVADDAPITAEFFAEKPERVLGALMDMQAAWAREHGEALPLDELVTRFEMSLEDELPSKWKPQKRTNGTTKTTSTTAGETKAAAVLSNRDIASPTRPRQEPKTWDEEKAEAAELLRELQGKTTS